MRSADGIEVFIRPCGAAEDDLTLTELELLPDNDAGNNCKMCCVPWTHERLKVVIKLSESFRMYSASVLHIGIDSQIMGRDKKSVLYHWKRAKTSQLLAKYVKPLYFTVMKPAQASSEQYPGRLMARKFNMRLVDEKQFTLADDLISSGEVTNSEYSEALSAGAFVVTIQRGEVQLIDQEEDSAKHMYVRLERQKSKVVLNISGSRGSQLGKHDWYKNGTFKRLHSKNGRKYRFEFRPRSQARLDEIADRLSQQTISDNVTTNPSSDGQGPNGEPRKIIDEGNPTELSIPEATLHKHPATRQKAPPATCECPAHTHGSRGAAAKDLSKQQGRPKPKKKPKLPNPGKGDDDASIDSALDTQGANATTRESDPAGDKDGKETTVRVCTRCEKIKKPPKGKKLAWRSRNQRWMYVPPNAPNEDVPEEDRDDEEVLPREIPGSESDGKDDGAVLPRSESDSESDAQSEQGDKESKSRDETNQASEILENPNSELDGTPLADGNPQVTADSNANATTSGRDPSSVPIAQAGELTVQPIPTTLRTNASDEIDLTAESDDDEIIEVGSNQVAMQDRKPTLEEFEDVEDLQYELREVKREKRKIELDQKEDAINRKLAKRQETKQKPTVKEEIKAEG